MVYMQLKAMGVNESNWRQLDAMGAMETIGRRIG